MRFQPQSEGCDEETLIVPLRDGAEIPPTGASRSDMNGYSSDSNGCPRPEPTVNDCLEWDEAEKDIDEDGQISLSREVMMRRLQDSGEDELGGLCGPLMACYGSLHGGLLSSLPRCWGPTRFVLLDLY